METLSRAHSLCYYLPKFMTIELTETSLWGKRSKTRFLDPGETVKLERLKMITAPGSIGRGVTVINHDEVDLVFNGNVVEIPQRYVRDEINAAHIRSFPLSLWELMSGKYREVTWRAGFRETEPRLGQAQRAPNQGLTPALEPAPIRQFSA